jgi:hypothetical protein
MVSSRGGRFGFVFRNRHDVYRALRRKGMTKEAAARIANEGHTKLGRKLMARKAAATRKGRAGKLMRAVRGN